MFTGIVEELGRLKSITHGRVSARLTIECNKILDDINLGDSIAVNGICLTVTEVESKSFAADVMPETLRSTNLGRLKPSESVNLERALSLSGRLGGHIVTGHIDGTGIVSAKEKEDNSIWLTVKVSHSILRYIVKKGSVAVNGVSLTVAALDDNVFKVSLIPLTGSSTVLGGIKIGDIVNIECDILGKYIERLINMQSEAKGIKSGLSYEFLRQNGFA
ncbi:MAG TPA: riboflavin synthase [Clostridia bacterium]